MYKGRDLMKLGQDEMREVRGTEIAMIFQDPMTSLNPVYTRRLADRRADPGPRGRVEGPGARAGPIELLGAVGIPNAAPAGRRLPAPVLGRHAPARDDRDGALVQPRPADRRRADDGARRDDPGADPRADRAAQVRLRLGGRPDHPRHGRGRRRRRPRRGDVRRPGRRAAAPSASSSTTPSIRTPGGCSARSRGSTGPSPSASRRSAGTPPSLLNLPQGCSFGPRCPHALRALRRGAPARGPAATTATSTPASSTPSRSAAAARRRSTPSSRRESA